MMSLERELADLADKLEAYITPVIYFIYYFIHYRVAFSPKVRPDSFHKEIGILVCGLCFTLCNQTSRN